MTHLIVIICLPYTIFCVYLVDFQLDIDFPSRFCLFYLKFYLKSPVALLKDRCLKKMLLKRAKSCLLFRKAIGSNNSFILI